MIPRIDAACLIDPADPGCPNLQADMLRAATETGFLTVHNTALSADDVMGVIEAYRAFFRLPLAAKARIDMAATGSNRGWGAAGAERVDPGANPDYKQVFDMGFALPPGDPLAAHGLKYYAANRFPDAMDDFQRTLEDYFARAMQVSLGLLRALARSLGQPDRFFDAKFDRPMALLRGNFYPQRPQWATERDFGIAAHTDYGCLTLLATDGTPGLEVQTRNDGWLPLSAPPGEFIINFGEMLEMWTGGRVRATPHRVIGTDVERISVPLFFNPNYDTNVAPIGSGDTILAGDHLSKRYDETYLHLSRNA